MQPALYYKKTESGITQCLLCPHKCSISEGSKGICGVRAMKNGVLYAETFGQLSSLALDPIEKKPLYHFYPGREILSIGSVGCTMKCLYCQNNTLSRCDEPGSTSTSPYTVDDIKKQLHKLSLNLLAFTYNEPVVFYEYMLSITRALSLTGTECVMVTNGYINKDPLAELLPNLSAFNVDIKSYSESFYRKICGASLKPVLNTIEFIKLKEKHLELTYLVIPGLNDNEKDFYKFLRFLSKNFGRSQVLHLSRYFPRHKMQLPPTSIQSIKDLIVIAKTELDYVYPGNTGIELDSNTYCPNCGQLLIERKFYTTEITGLHDNHCSTCGKNIYGKYV